MICPECGNEMLSGEVKAHEVGSIFEFGTQLYWYPDEEKKKLIKWDLVHLQIKGSGYHCETCKKVFAIFDEEEW